MELKTPLYDCHVRYGGKIVPFGGYLLPVQYGTGVIGEHMAVRNVCGLFDVSHMGEVVLEGKDALKNIQMLVTNDCAGLLDGRARYSPMCNESGGIVDDLLIYRINEEKYLLVINASNREKDVLWIRAHIFGQCVMSDISDSIAQLALQGPRAKKVLCKITDEKLIPEKYYTFIYESSVGGIKCLLSRTGYTGEDGFELYCASEDAARLWKLLLETGSEEGLIPCGLGARDTLRLEAAMPLYGHEMNDSISPLETGLSAYVKLKKEDFIGKPALINRGEPTQRRVGLKITGRGIARENCPVFYVEKQIGATTSGTHCPFLGYPAAMAIIDMEYSEVGTKVEVDIRGRRVSAEIVPMPFYKR